MQVVGLPFDLKNYKKFYLRSGIVIPYKKHLAGASETVTIEIPIKDLAYYNNEDKRLECIAGNLYPSN